MRKAQDAEREQDAFYRMLFLKESSLRASLARGVLNMVNDVSTHPATHTVHECLQSKTKITPIVEKALILAALCNEPEFVQYMLDMEEVSSSAVSQFTVQNLVPSIEKVLDGNLKMPEFVLESLVDYVSL